MVPVSGGRPLSFEFICDTDPDWLIVIDRAVAIGEGDERALRPLDDALAAKMIAWREGQMICPPAAESYVAGGGVQALGRNRFLEPTTAGTRQGAALGILGVTLLWPDASVAMQMAVASLGALASTAAFLVLVRRLPPTQPLLVPLVVLVYRSITGAMVVVLGYRFDLLHLVEVRSSMAGPAVPDRRPVLLASALLLLCAAFLTLGARGDRSFVLPGAAPGSRRSSWSAEPARSRPSCSRPSAETAS